MSKKDSSLKSVKKNIKKETHIKPSHVTHGNVFEDLGFSSVESLLLGFRTDIHSLILKQIANKGYDRRQLERILDEPQPRVSELLTGKISKMSLDKLVRYLFKLGAELAHHQNESGIRLPAQQVSRPLLRAAEPND